MGDDDELGTGAGEMVTEEKGGAGRMEMRFGFVVEGMEGGCMVEVDGGVIKPDVFVVEIDVDVADTREHDSGCR